MAPPVYSDPPGMVATTPFVGPAPGVAPTAPLPPPPVPAPPIAVVPALPATAGSVHPALPTAMRRRRQEFLRVMPERLDRARRQRNAPQGQHLRGRRHLLANQRVDWSIARNGVGQFTELGFRDYGQLLSWWEAPHKLDNWSATSTTAIVPITLNTSTPDPNDDVPIFRGESWVTVTSAVEGTSVITAYATAYSEFNQATSTIYWVDAQWFFPQPSIVEPGRSHTLTTTLMRRTDGAPLAGWIVRYDVSGGATGLRRRQLSSSRRRRRRPRKRRSQPQRRRRRRDQRWHHGDSPSNGRARGDAATAVWAEAYHSFSLGTGRAPVPVFASVRPPRRPHRRSPSLAANVCRSTRRHLHELRRRLHRQHTQAPTRPTVHPHAAAAGSRGWMQRMRSTGPNRFPSGRTRRSN